MRRSGKGSGGGAGMNKVVRKPVRTGAARQGPHVAGVAQLGQRVGDHTTEHRQSSGYRGEDLIGPKRPISERLGNEVAAQTQCGPGGSRQIYKSGFQQTHGATNSGQPMKPSKPLWEGWE